MFIVYSMLVDMQTGEVDIEPRTVCETELGALCHALAFSVADRYSTDWFKQIGLSHSYGVMEI